MSDEEIKRLIAEEIEKKMQGGGASRDRIFQDDITPNAVKQRHIDGTIVKFGVIADRPTDGGAVGILSYFTTDTSTLYLWNGSAWVIGAGTGNVTLAMLADMATASLYYRKTAGNGAPEVNTVATLVADIKATGAEIVTGSSDAKLVTPKSLVDAFILSQAFTTWNSTLTNITIGGGTVVAKYTRVGKFVAGYLNVIFASDTSIGGAVSFSLPVTSVSYAGGTTAKEIGRARILDSGTATYGGTVLWTSTTTSVVKVLKTDGTYLNDASLSSTVPMTWTTDDELYAQFFYEAA